MLWVLKRFSSNGREGLKALRGLAEGLSKSSWANCGEEESRQHPLPHPFLRSLGPLASCSHPGPAPSNETQEYHAHTLLIYISPPLFFFFFWHYRKRAEWLLFPGAQITPAGIWKMKAYLVLLCFSLLHFTIMHTVQIWVFVASLHCQVTASFFF